jgi:hypothetical protein
MMASGEHCPVTWKISYPNRKAARKHRKALSRNGIRRNIFFCHWCWQYHVGRPRGRGGGRA